MKNLRGPKKNKLGVLQQASSEYKPTPALSAELEQIDTAPVDFLSIQGVPADPAERDRMSKAIGGNFELWLEDRLSEPDRGLIRKHGLTPPDEATCLRVRAALDNIILEQARILGWCIFLSDIVVNRIRQWWTFEKNGPRLLGRLGEALALGARVIRGQAKMPLDKKYYPFKKEIKAELRALQNALRVDRAVQGSLARPARLLDLIRGYVMKPEQPFPQLQQNWTALCRFLKQRPKMARGLVSGGMTIPHFVDAWISWSTHRSPEALRQAISTLGRPKARR